MRRAATYLVLAGIILCGSLRAAEPERPQKAPDFQEVYDLIRKHLAGVEASELNQKAVEGLLQALGARVSLVGSNEPQSIEMSGGALVKKSSLFEGPIAYVRIGRVEAGVADAVRQAYEHIGTNRVNGVVIDLRFCSGNDYAAAAATADLFIKQEKPLIDWGNGMVRSKEKTDAITVPVAVLVNRETSRAAEALAAVMREAGVGLIVGSRTAGQALIAQEYPLSNGQKLRIATAAVQVGGGVSLSSEGLKPDLLADVSLQDERSYMADAFKQLNATNVVAGSTAGGNTNVTGTNRTRRIRFSEAELVRERREGLPSDIEVSGRSDGEGEKPVVRDPALARALDVLKGLAVVRQSRS